MVLPSPDYTCILVRVTSTLGGTEQPVLTSAINGPIKTQRMHSFKLNSFYEVGSRVL